MSFKVFNFKKTDKKPSKFAMIIFAILSKASYSTNPQEVLEKFGLLNQFYLLKEYSNKDVLSVKEKSTENIIIAIRGTDIKNETNNLVRDLVSNYGILTAKDERVLRIKETEDILDNIIKKYPKENIILTGHSLGAFVASKLSTKYGLKAVVFNIGSSPLDTTSGKDKNIIQYTTNDPLRGKVDPLSITSTLRDDFRNIRVKQKEGVPIHSIDNFLPSL
jgi:hypothetical protein